MGEISSVFTRWKQRGTYNHLVRHRTNRKCR